MLNIYERLIKNNAKKPPMIGAITLMVYFYGVTKLYIFHAIRILPKNLKWQKITVEKHIITNDALLLLLSKSFAMINNNFISILCSCAEGCFNLIILKFQVKFNGHCIYF